MHGVEKWLSRASLRQTATALGLTLAEVAGVANFYRFFHTQPVGNYRVLSSDNVTDRLFGNEALMTGLCDQGPALLIKHHQVLTRLDAAQVCYCAAMPTPSLRA